MLGVTTNLPYLLRLVGHPALKAGELHTGFIEEHAADLAPPPPQTPELIAAALALTKPRVAATTAVSSAERGIPSPWDYLGDWSNTG